MLFEDDDAEHIRTWLNGVPLDESVAAQRIPCLNENDWLVSRAKGVGASEVGVIVGASTWTSPYALWWRKKLDWRLPRTEGQRWGHLVEDPIATLFAEETGDELYVAKPAGHPYSLWCNNTHNWVMCTPDRLAVDRAGKVYPVELKSDEGGDGWGAPESDQVPRQYRCQALWQAYVFGSAGTYVVRKRGSGKRRMVWYWVPFDPGETADLITRAWDFTVSIERNSPPDPDGTKATTDTLKDLNAVEVGTYAVIPGDLYTWWSDARANKREAIAAEAALSNRMRHEMGTAEFAITKTTDGMDVIRARRRVGKRQGYEVGPAVTDELREVGSAPRTASPDLPGPESGPHDGQATQEAPEENPRGTGGEGGEVGPGTEGTTGSTYQAGPALGEPPTPDNPYGLPPELARIVDLSLVDTDLLAWNPKTDNDCGA